jgi:hypothetical protein
MFGLQMSILGRATAAQRVVFCLKMSLMRRVTIARRGIFLSACIFHATSARWVVPLQVAASLLWHPSWVCSFIWQRRSMASFRSLRHFFFGYLTGITVAFSAGTSAFCAASGFLSGEVGFYSS